MMQFLKHFLWLFLLVMPLGVQVDPEHPGELTLGVHGGSGQVLSVIRDCAGNPVASERSSYVDVAASVQVSHRSESGSFTVFGVRSGYLHSDARRPMHNYLDGTSSYEELITYSYFNPYIAVERRYIGIGIGYLSGEVPTAFGHDSTIPISGHLRLGNYDKTNFLVSLNENLPLASGGGYFNLGINYPAGRRVRLFTGISAGFYDRIGLVQQVSLPLSDRFGLDLNARVGPAAGQFEGGFAAGLRYHLPLH